MIPTETHPAAPLICHAAEHGVPIALLQGMDKDERDAAILYGTHASARKEAEFIHTELADQVQAGHVAVPPLEEVNLIKNLWLLPVAVIPQVGMRLRLIYDFTWSGLNETSKRLSPMEEMRFGGALQCILKQVLTKDLRLGPVYLSKIDLTYTYMSLWLRM